MRSVLATVTAAAATLWHFAAAQPVGGVTGKFEKIVPVPNEDGNNIYPDIKPLWRHAGPWLGA